MQNFISQILALRVHNFINGGSVFFFTSDMLTSSCWYHTACIHRLKKEFWTIVFPFPQDKDYYNAICLSHFHRIRQLVAHRRSTSCKPNQLNESFFTTVCVAGSSTAYMLRWRHRTCL